MPVAFLVGQHRQDEDDQYEQAHDENDDQLDPEASGRHRQRHSSARARRVLVMCRTVQIVHLLQRQKQIY